MADKSIQGIIVKIGGDATDLGRIVQSAEKEAAGLNKELAQVNKLLKIDPKNTELLAQKQQLLSKAVETTSKKLEGLKSAQEKVNKAHAANAEWEKQYAPLGEAIDATKSKISELDAAAKAAKQELAEGKISTAQYQQYQDELTKTKTELKALQEQKKELDKQFTDGHLSDEEYRRYQREVAATSAKLKKLTSDLEDTEKQSKELSDETEKSESTAKKLGKAFKKLAGDTEEVGEKAKDSKDGLGTMQVALGNLVAQGIQAAISGIKELLENTLELRQDLTKLTTNADDAGVSTQQMTESLKYLNAVCGETDSNIEGLSNLFAAGFKGDSLTRAIEALSGAVIKFPDTLKIESLADSLQETLATGAATGQFAELLERMGLDLDKFNTGLERATKSGREQEYALEVLARTGLSETAQKYRENNQALIESADAQFEYQTSMAELGEILQPIANTVLKVINQYISQNKETIQKLATSLSNLFVSLLPIAEILVSILGILAKIDPAILIALGTLFTTIAVITRMASAFNNISKAGEGIAGLFGKTINPTFVKTVAIITSVVILLLAFAAVITVITGKGGELERTLGSIGNSIGNMSNDINSATRSGTRQSSLRSATTYSVPLPETPMMAKGGILSEGQAIIAEAGPELLRVNGGRAVVTPLSQSAKETAVGTSGAVNNYYYVTIPAKDVKEFNDIIRIAQNKRQRAVQMGV